MGKGDKKTKKGKISMGSYGNKRIHHPKKHKPVETVAATAEKK